MLKPDEKTGATPKASTPAHTRDALRSCIEKAVTDKKTGAAYLNIDTRVLEWLLADSAALDAVLAAAAGGAP